MNGKLISTPAAVLVLMLFFVPWVTVSCEGMQIGEFSGYELAAGSVAGADNINGIDGDPTLFLIPLAALIALGLLAYGWRQPSFATNANWGIVITAVAGLLILFFKWFQRQGDQSIGFDILIQPGLWGTLIGLIAMGAGAVWELGRGEPDTAVPTPYTPIKPVTPIAPVAPLPTPFASRPPAPPTVVDPQDAANATLVDEPPSRQLDPNATLVDDDTTRQQPLPPAPLPYQPVAKTEALHLQADLMALLVLGSGPNKGERFRLRKETTIGRDPVHDIVVDDSSVSALHAIIRAENGRFTIHDQDSTNGIFIFDSARDRWEPRQHAALQDGDRIKLGRVVFHLMTLSLDES